MLALYRTLSLRYFQQRRSRAVLVVASVALGVALLVATRAINASMVAAARSAVAPFSSHAELNVTSDGGVPFKMAARLAHLPGVSRAEPLVFGRVRLPGLDNRPAQVIGLVWRADSLEDNPWGVTIDWVISPSAIPGLTSVDPQKALIFANQLDFHPVLVGQDLDTRLRQVPISPQVEGFLDGLIKRLESYKQAARLFHGVPGADSTDVELLNWSKKALELVRHRAELLHGRVVEVQPVGQKPRRLVSVGVPHAEREAEEAFLRDALVMNAADAADLLGQPNRATRIDLFLRPGADQATVVSEVRQALHGQAQVRTPDDDEQRVQGTMVGLEFGFSLLGAGALVVGLFLIYLVLSVSVVERRHQIGILRSLGATRPQVWGLFVGEASLLGLVGAILGIPVGLAAARYLGIGFIEKLLSDFLYDMKAPPPEVTFSALLLAAAAGLVVAVLAALLPAVHAGREEPASAVRRIPPRETWGHRLLQLAASILLLAGGVVAVLFRQQLADPRWGTYGGFVSAFLGALLATPLLAAVVARVLQPLARVCLGMQGRLAADNLVRAPGRTGLVITVLAAGVAIFIQTAGVIRSNKLPIMSWVNRTVDADLFITSGSAQVGSGQNLPIEADLGKEIESRLHSEVQAAVPTRSRQVSFGNNMVYLLAIDARGFAHQA
ncbi:MAG TPA: ABC transporter permease, partial [Gemmataceae bacterium]|nr:ABC transporter permease [Gemmataceae bacterium]